MMRFLADENFPGDSVTLLADAGHDVFSLSKLHPGYSDYQALELAIQEDRIILTFDRDFGKMLFRDKSKRPPGIVFFRLHPVTPDQPGNMLLSILNDSALSLTGRFTVVEPEKFRQRKI